jgi:energy-coupling factor transporter ATP-binding protein EcfA2
VNEPAIVLLDEPFTGLDRRAAERLARRLEALRRGGHTLILVTHDVARAAELSDAALVLSRGRVAHRSEGPSTPRDLERGYLAALEAAP